LNLNNASKLLTYILIPIQYISYPSYQVYITSKIHHKHV